MSNKMWDALVEHAKTCVLSGKLYVYYPDDMKSIGVVFSNIYELCGFISGGQYHSVDSLSEDQKVCILEFILLFYIIMFDSLFSFLLLNKLWTHLIIL